MKTAIRHSFHTSSHREMLHAPATILNSLSNFKLHIVGTNLISGLIVVLLIVVLLLVVLV